MLQTFTIDDGLLSSTQYCYTVTAIDTAGNESLHSSQSCATTLADFIDLSVSRVGTRPCVTEGPSTCVSFDIANNGTLNASNVPIIYISSSGYFFSCQLFTASFIQPGSFQTFDTFIFPEQDWFIIIDPDNTIPESSKTNNTACGGSFCTLPPNVNDCF